MKDKNENVHKQILELKFCDFIHICSLHAHIQWANIHWATAANRNFVYSYENIPFEEHLC